MCSAIERKCGLAIPTGYGVVTYYALKEFGLLPEGTARISTIGDLLVSGLCGRLAPSHPTGAASLGVFDTAQNEYDLSALKRIGIPRKVLPDVSGDYELAGGFACSGRTVPVAVAIGDNQASALGALDNDGAVLVNVGTGSQVSVITGEDHAGSAAIRPYFDGKYLICGAPLCGGNAYAMVKDLIRSALRYFGVGAGDRAVYEYMNGQAATCMETGVKADTRFCGTREDPAVRGGFSNIGANDLTVGALSAATLRGMIDELYGLYRRLPGWERGRKTVVSGNAMRYNPTLRKLCADRFGTGVLLPANSEEAACGAALFAGISAGIITREQSRRLITYKTDAC